MPRIPERGLDICRQAEAAFARKGSLDQFWQETAENFYPERADFTVTKQLGEDMASTLYSSEPIIFRREFGNWLGAVLRPKGREWFLPRARREEVNDLPEVKSWLERRGKVTRSLLYDNKSQFIRAMTAADHDWAAFGNSVVSIEERQDKTGLRFRNWHLRDCAWEENYDGEIDKMYRRFPMSVRNLCAKEREGWEISKKVKNKLKDQPGLMINCMHIVMPVWDYDYSIKKPKTEWVSCYYDMDNKFEMSMKFVPEFNYVVSRWFTIAGSPYGFSPCVCAALPDARTLQTMTWSILEAGEKAVEPPTIAVAEAIIGGVDLRAGYTTWVDSRYDERTGEALRPVQLGEQPQFGEILRQGITSTLSMAFYINRIFLPQDTTERTAEEMALRNAEFLRTTQPIIDPAEAERSGKTIDLVISMSMRAGYWGDMREMPEPLRGEHVDVTYDNPVEDARKQAKMHAYVQALGVVGQTKELGDVGVVANFDNNKAFRDALIAFPPDWCLTEDEAEKAVTKLREDLDEAEGVMQAEQAANVAANLTKSGVIPPANGNRRAAPSRMAA